MMADYSSIIQSAAKQYNIDPSLIRAVIQVESSGNPNAKSSVGAVGLGQLMPATAQALGVKDPTDPNQAIPAIANLLNENLNRYGNVQDALRAYHGGTDQKNWGPLTQAYPGKVLSNLSKQSQPTQPQVLPGIPTAAPSGNQSDDAIFSAFSKGGAPTQQQQGPQSDDAIFAAMTKSAAPNSAAASPQASPQQPTGPQPGTGASFLAGLGRGVQETALGAQQLLGHGLQSLGTTGQGMTPQGQSLVGAIGRAGDWLVNNANQGLQAGAQQIAPYQQAHPIATGAGNIGGAMAATAPLVLGAPAGTGLLGLAGRGAVSGAAMGAVSPVSPDSQNYGSDKLRQMGVGALLGAATPALVSGAVGAGRYTGNVIGSALQPFTSAGQQIIAEKILSRAAQGGPSTSNLSQLVAGSSPTLAEATANPGIATLQRTIRDINPNPFVAQEQQNAMARLTQLHNALGTPAELDAAQNATRQIAGDLGGAVAANNVAPTAALNDILSRPSLMPIVKDAEKAALNATGSNPFQAARDALSAQRLAQYQSISGSPQALDAARQARDTLANALYSQANAERFTSDSVLNNLLKRPSMQQAVARAQKLASETGQPLKIGVDLPSQTIPSKILNAEGEPAFSLMTPAQQASFSGRALNYIKMGLDDLISSGSQTGGIIGHEKSALNSTKGNFLNWMDSKSPIYQKARQTYAQMSEPINAMETLQGLNLTDAAGSIVPSKLDSAIKSIISAQAEKGINPAKSVTPQQLQSLSGLLDSVNSDRLAPIPSNLGPTAIGHIQTAITNALNGSKALAPETQSALQQAQSEILSTLKQQNPQAMGMRSNVPGTAAGDFMGPITLPQQAEMQARSAQSMQLLQGMNLTDASGNVTLAKVQNALKSLQKQGLQADPNKMAALVSVRDDLLRASNTGLGRSAGSATAQNLATQNMLNAALPGKLGSLVGKLPAGTVGGTAGGGVGYLLGGPIGATLGSAAGSFVGRTLGGLANASNEQIQANLANMLLNPQLAAPALNRAAGSAAPVASNIGLQRLLYPAITTGGVRSLGGRNGRP